MKSNKKTTPKVVSTKSMPSPTADKVVVSGGGGINLVGPGLNPPYQLKDYKKPGAT